jgi:hypothetical protein
MALSLLRPAARYEIDAYLTDGRRLFRVVEQLNPALDRPALLEDCLTLELKAYRAKDLWDLRLRTVRP